MEKVRHWLLTLFNQHNLIIVDYFAKYPKVIPVSSKSTQATIKVIMSVFSRHGIPDTVIADIMLLYINVELHKFDWDITITTLSSNYPHSNSLVELSIQMTKWLFSKGKESNTSTHLTLLEYRNTPTSAMDMSPVQLLISRWLHFNLPMMKSLLSPQINNNAKDNLEMRSKSNTKIEVQDLYRLYVKAMFFDTKQDLNGNSQ